MFPSTATFTDFYMKKERTVTEPLLTASINMFPDQLQHLQIFLWKEGELERNHCSLPPPQYV